MPFLPVRAVRLTVTGLVVVGALALTGCTSKTDSPGKAAAADPPTTGTPATSTADDTPSPTESPSTTPTIAQPATATDALLATDAVPGLNATWHWQDGRTGPAGTDPFGPCAKVDLLSIGATDVVERTYFPPVDTDDNAAEQIADFPDANTAARAAAVLKSWHDKCTQQDKRLKVGAITSVSVGSGAGSWYLVTSRPAGSEETRFQAFGIAAVGTRIAVLQIVNGGQHYNYPAGKEPMVAMVTAAAARLG
jgi:hypothetical protein